MAAKQTLPDEIRSLVRESVAVLGEIIERERGRDIFEQIESLRRRMAALRGSSEAEKQKVLRETLDELRRAPGARREAIAHSFALMLELMNSCENAYRTYRLRARPRHSRATVSAPPQAVIYVLTAHPTEARAPANIEVFRRIQEVLVEALAEGFDRQRERLRYLLELSWRVSIARERKPAVKDEAEHIFSILLDPRILETLIQVTEDLTPVYVRTWVGGDKDGHPGVNQKTMLESLALSRQFLFCYVQEELRSIRHDLALLGSAPLDRRWKAFQAAFVATRKLARGDGKRVKDLRSELHRLMEAYSREIGAAHPGLIKIRQLSRMFPGLVVPLELRESSDILVERKARPLPAIARMLGALREISRGGNPQWYARGLIVSMTRNVDDLRAACGWVKSELGELKIPVVPLFEQSSALEKAPRILEELLEDPEIRYAIGKHWNGYLEVMLGYSDSAKEMGVLASRVAIAEALGKIDRLARRAQVTPLFFHGSGGSVDRGGGSVEDQTSWWPKSAVCLFKATVQGEMIERSFASPVIARGQFERIAESTDRVLKRDSAQAHQRAPELKAFAARVSEIYAAKIASPEFLQIIQRSTGYRFLSELKIGSRPTKRGKVMSVAGLRAIPWVLGWTQVRVLFPTWWGVGTAWREARVARKRALRQAFVDDPLFRSYIKALGFTLAKVELSVWRIYLENTGLSGAQAKATFEEFEREYRDAAEMVRFLSRSSNLLWFRPWLGTSIELRSPMIHPLNLLQLIGLETGNARLIRETVTGISSGMMTTG